MHNCEVKIEKTRVILYKILEAMQLKEPFSLVRWGDGALKMIHAYYYNDEELLDAIIKKEGIPMNKLEGIFNLWASTANIANYIDTPAVYGTNIFWDRVRKHKSISIDTRKKLNSWKLLYKLAGFTNENYCNPEINFLMCLDIFTYRNLPSLMKNKKLCIITSRQDVYEALIEFDIDVIIVASQEKNQFLNSFNDVLNILKERSNDYDLILVAAGELGRIYTRFIKYKGGRAIDIGSLIDYWCTGKIPDRLKKFITFHPTDRLKTRLTYDGSKYKRFI